MAIITNTQKIKNSPGYWAEMTQSFVLRNIGYNPQGGEVRVPVSSHLLETPVNRNSLGFLLRILFGANVVLQKEENWPIVYNLDGSASHLKGIIFSGISNEEIFEESMSIFNYEFAQIIGYVPGSNTGSLDAARALGVRIIKYLNLGYLIPVLYAGDPAAPIAQSIGLPWQNRDFPYPQNGYGGILTRENVKELLQYFYPVSVPNSIAKKADFLYRYMIPTSRKRGVPSIFTEEEIEYLLSNQ